MNDEALKKKMQELMSSEGLLNFMFSANLASTKGTLE